MYTVEEYDGCSSTEKLTKSFTASLVMLRKFWIGPVVLYEEAWSAREGCFKGVSGGQGGGMELHQGSSLIRLDRNLRTL